MDVRRGVLRCSSRKLRSSSFVELVAGDRDRTQIKKTEADTLIILDIKKGSETQILCYLTEGKERSKPASVFL